MVAVADLCRNVMQDAVSISYSLIYVLSELKLAIHKVYVIAYHFVVYISKYKNVYSESVHIIYFIRILKKKWLCFNNNLDIKSQIFRFKFKDSKKF